MNLKIVAIDAKAIGSRSFPIVRHALRLHGARTLLLFSILESGAYLRSVGLTWGLESGYGHHKNFHPDEFLSMRGVLQLDLLKGKFKAPAAYSDGTFSHYLWALPVAAVEFFNIPRLPTSLRHGERGKPQPQTRAERLARLTDAAHFPMILYLCRLMTVVFDVVAIFVVFLATREATRSFYPALLAAFFYSIIPMQEYNTFSIYNELRWALDPAAEFPQESVVDIGKGLVCDPHITPTLQLAGLEETLRRRSLIELVTRRVAQCRLVIITLGLAEVWRDTVADTFINIAPIPEVFRSHPDRYEFHVTNFAQNYENLENIHALLGRFGHADVQLVVTISPIPLMATFSTQDVVIANTYSKSMLRAVAQEWTAAHKNVHYFPSYEIVQNSDRAVTWEEDLRHVKGKLVNHIMHSFLQYCLER
jgi:hypothetical protein